MAEMENNLENEQFDAPEQQPAPEKHKPARKKKRGKGLSVTAILLLLVAIVLFVVGGTLGLLYNHNYKHLEEMKAAVDVQGFYPGITIDGVDVSGRSYEEVREEILARQQAEADARVLKVEFEGKTYELAASSVYNTEQVVVDAYNYAKEGELQDRYNMVTALQQQPMDFATTCEITVEGVDEFVQRIAADVEIAAIDATVGAFDLETKSFAFTEEVNGRALDVNKLRADIQSAIDSGDFSLQITPVVTDVPAAVTKAQLEQQNQLLGTYTTETTKSSSRNTNIRLAAEAFNGFVLAPGEEFSINTVTGPRTTAKGYKNAGAIVDGILVDEPGGGVCQVSTTLFNAVVRAGMEITERWGHSWPSDYVSIGMDAAIDYPGKDFKFINTSTAPIYLVSHFDADTRKLTVEVYGTPVLPEGVTVELRSTTDATLKRGEDKYVYDETLAPGTEVQIRKGRDGKKSTTYIQYFKDGEVIEEKVLFTTTYPSIRAIINYGPELSAAPETNTGSQNDSNIWP